MAQKLQALHYVRPDFDAFRLEFIAAVQKFKKCESVGQVHAAIQNIDNLTKNIISSYETLKTLAVQSPDNLSYQTELELWQQHQALFTENNNRFFTGLIKSKFRSQLESMIPPVKFMLAENQINAYTTENNDLITSESELLLAYKNILSTANIEIDGTLVPMGLALRNYSSYILPVQNKIFEHIHNFLILNKQTLLALHQQIISNRTKQAKNADFSNYSDFKLKISNHFDYSLSQITTLCEHILTVISTQQTLLPLEKSSSLINFKSDKQFLTFLEDMFTNISPDMATFFQYLIEHDVLKITTDPTSNITSVATFIPYNETPHLTINRDSLPLALSTMLNQLGSTFQAYSVRGLRSSDLLFSLPTSQASIAKSLEFIVLPWISKTIIHSDLIYQQNKITEAVLNIRLAAANITFLTACYQNNTISAEEMTTLWYQNHNSDWPNKTDMLWLLDFEILNEPFTDIDTILSTLIGLQFWQPTTSDDNNSYLAMYYFLAKNSSNLSFANLVASVDGLLSPIESDTVNYLLKKVDTFKAKKIPLSIN